MAPAVPIPPEVTIYVGGRNHPDGKFYCLIRNQQLLTIQAVPCVQPEIDYLSRPGELEKVEKEHRFGLEKIQTLLRGLEFRSNWAYLLGEDDGTGFYRLVYRHKPVYSISCATWAPLVEEREIHLTRWISCEKRCGIWNGMEVDLLMGWDDTWARFVEWETAGQQLMLGLGLTFEVLGHVVRDGEVVGLMTQPANGRMVEFGDRTAVYEAIAKVQGHGLLYRSIFASNIMIHEGRVRLLQLSAVDHYPKHKLSALEDLAKRLHWARLDEIFGELQARSNFNVPKRSTCLVPKFLFPPPSPERPLVSSLLIRINLYRSFNSDTVEEDRFSTRSNTRRRHNNHTSQVRIGPLTCLRPESPRSHAICDVADSPLDRRTLWRRSQPPRILHPYSRPTERISIALYDDSGTSSEDGSPTPFS